MIGCMAFSFVLLSLNKTQYHIIHRVGSVLTGPTLQNCQLTVSEAITFKFITLEISFFVVVK